MLGGRYTVGKTRYTNAQHTVSVFEAADEVAGGRVAIKMVRNTGHLDELRSEVEFYRHLVLCKHVVKLLDFFQDDDHSYFVMECAEHDLVDVIGKGLCEEQARSIFVQLLEAVRELHAHGVVHRDLKCENILFTEGGVLKLCDFGLAAFVESGSGTRLLTRRCGTRPYISPEQLSGLAGYDGFASDVWSIGVILVALRSGCLPFREASAVCKRFVYFCQRKTHFAPWSSFSELFLSLLYRVLEPEPGIRACIDELATHPWCALGAVEAAVGSAPRSNSSTSDLG